MHCDTIAVIMAGGIRPSPLRRAIGGPALALPIAPDEPLLAWWLQALHDEGCREVHVIVSDHEDAERLDALVASEHRSMRVEVQVEAGRWRGTGGLLHDVTAIWGTTGPVLAVEGACLPPPHLHDMFSAARDDVARIAITPDRCPVGLTWLSPDALAAVPPIGFCDLKEQLLPLLYEQGRGARAVIFDDPGPRLRDRASYIEAVRRHAPAVADVDERAAWVVGACLIDASAKIDPSAVVHDSVILEGARIGANAIVSRSVIAPNAVVDAEQEVRSQIVTTEPARIGEKSA